MDKLIKLLELIKVDKSTIKDIKSLKFEQPWRVAIPSRDGMPSYIKWDGKSNIYINEDIISYDDIDDLFIFLRK